MSTKTFPLQLLYIEELQAFIVYMQQLWSPVSIVSSLLYTTFVQLLIKLHSVQRFSFMTGFWFSWVFIVYTYDNMYLSLHLFSPLTYCIAFTMISITSTTSGCFSLPFHMFFTAYLTRVAQGSQYLPGSTARPCRQVGLGESLCTNS